MPIVMTRSFAIKAAIADATARDFVFAEAKTMYGGVLVVVGDTLFLFASENEGGAGLIGRAIVTAAERVPRIPGIDRQTPRISIEARLVAPATRPLGRREIRGFRDWSDGRPETELNFKFYRQATNKVVRLSESAARFLTSLTRGGADQG